MTLRTDSLGAFVPGEEVVAEPLASGLLDGLTFAAKDVFDVAGLPTGFGNPTWLATHRPATATAPAVERLLSAGARLVGKTVTDELTYSLTGENAHYGAPVNPACPGRVAGGSSSGSAAAVAGGLCDLALGTDCAGSVRIPSSYCGLYGMRPTHGRIPLEGVCPFAPSFDTVGWMARDPSMLERAGAALLDAGAEAEPPARALLARDAFELAGVPVARALDGAVAAVAGLIGSVDEVEVSEEGLDRWRQCFQTIQAFEIWQSLGAWVRETKPALGPGIRDRIEHASTVGANEAESERRFRRTVVARLDAILGTQDVLVLPTAPGRAPARGAPPDEVEIVFRNRAISLLCIAGLGGLPQLTLPLGELEGCPLGLSLVGPRGADLALVRLGARLAAHRPAPAR